MLSGSMPKGPKARNERGSIASARIRAIPQSEDVDTKGQ
jgi:hypothetical protein